MALSKNESIYGKGKWKEDVSLKFITIQAAGQTRLYIVFGMLQWRQGARKVHGRRGKNVIFVTKVNLKAFRFDSVCDKKIIFYLKCQGLNSIPESVFWINFT